MLAFGSLRHAQTRRRELRTTTQMPYFKAEWMETGNDPHLSPTIFLIEQPANSTLEPHFHTENQFQLFVEGSGSIGASQIEPITVHYAGAYTGYGPLRAGSDGIKYLTIRPVLEQGANFIKDSRDKMIRGPKRHATAKPIGLTNTGAVAELNAPEAQTLIPFADDGLGALLFRLPAGAIAAADFPPASQGAFLVVLAGSLLYAGGELARWESVFASSAAELPCLSAGANGAQVVWLFIPPKSPTYSKCPCASSVAQAE